MLRILSYKNRLVKLEHYNRVKDIYHGNSVANALQALDMSKEEMNITLITSITKLVLLTLLALLKIGMYSLILSIIVILIISTFMHIKKIRNCLNS